MCTLTRHWDCSLRLVYSKYTIVHCSLLFVACCIMQCSILCCAGVLCDVQYCGEFWNSIQSPATACSGIITWLSCDILSCEGLPSSEQHSKSRRGTYTPCECDSVSCPQLGSSWFVKFYLLPRSFKILKLQWGEMMPSCWACRYIYQNWFVFCMEDLIVEGLRTTVDSPPVIVTAGIWWMI